MDIDQRVKDLEARVDLLDRVIDRYRRALKETAEHCYCDLHKRLAREALAVAEERT